MIQYHFAGKAGLLEAAFREALGPVLEQRGALPADAGNDEPLRRFIEICMRTLAANPWLPKMMVRHVLPDGGQLQSIAVQLIGSRVGPVIGALIERDRSRLSYRSEIVLDESEALALPTGVPVEVDFPSLRDLRVSD
jgi:TetR/AcrR family transcriptional regulator